MTCGTCGTENPDRARFCMSCGAPLAAACPSCGTENPPEAKFCIECGTSLTGAPAPGPPGAEEPLPEERRKATILFADLSGYTAVAERLDPERMKSMVDRALRRLGDEIERYGGTIDKYIGDNVMGVFGAPVAHEDDPERAVRAGLAMQAAMEEINDRIAADLGASFALRVGINSGEVLAGRVGDGYTVIGDPVNVAARLQAAAKPGTVTVGEITHRLTRAAIEYVELEPLELKGKAEPVCAWEAVRAVVRGRAARAAGSWTPLVGRDDESDLLLSLFERVVSEGRPHLVTVIGQAGVGKSRLLRELTLSIGDRPSPPAVRLGSCPAYGAGLAYWALGEIVRGTFEIVDTDDAESAWRKLCGGIDALLEETDEPTERVAAALGRPLGIEPPNGGPGETAEHDDPQQMRERLFSAVRILVEAASAIAAAGVRGRGHPLGRRGDARPDRAPGALGPGAGADRLPRPRRAARPAPRLGRRTDQRDHDHARPARPRSGPGAGRGAAGGRGRRGRRARRAGRRALRRQPAVRGGDGQPDRRGGRRRRRGPAGDRALGARRAPRLAVATGAPGAAGGVGGRPDLLGGLGRGRGHRRDSTCGRRSSRCAART